jgi:hypothetical protein
VPKNIKILIKDQDGDSEENLELEFADDDWEALQDFAKYAAKLEKNSLVQEGIPSSLTVSWTAGEDRKVDAKLPSDEQIDALLMKLRPFLLNDAPTNFNRVRNIVWKAASNQRMQKHLNTLKFLYSGERLQSLFVAGVSSRDQDPRIINSEDMLQVWLNGERFHQEKKKEKILNAINEIMPPESSLALFLFLLADKVAAILALGRMIKLLAGKHEIIFAGVIVGEPIHYYALLHASIAQFDILPLEKEPAPLPQEGVPFARVFDLTPMGPATLHQLLDPIGQLWMHGRLVYEIGERHYFFRTAPGFRTERGVAYEHGADVIATFKVVAFLAEDPVSEARRKPEQTTLERMRAAREGSPLPQRKLKSIETQEELDRLLSRDPAPKVDFIVVPRVVFLWAYWPTSRQARERARRIHKEGRTPTFEEVEGTDISKAWEIFEEEISSESGVTEEQNVHSATERTDPQG